MEAEPAGRAGRLPPNSSIMPPDMHDHVKLILQSSENWDFGFLRRALRSIDSPEQMGINEFLFTLAFHPEHPIEAAARLIHEAASLPSFPADSFSDPEHIGHLLEVLQSNVSDTLFSAASNVLSTVLEKSEAVYQRLSTSDILQILELVASNHKLVPVACAMAFPWNIQKLPPEACAALCELAFAVIVDERDEIAHSGLFLVYIFLQSGIELDMNRLNEVIHSRFDARLLAQLRQAGLVSLLCSLPEPPLEFLEDLLEMLKSGTEKEREEALTVLRKFTLMWPDEVHGMIRSALMDVLDDLKICETRMALEVIGFCQTPDRVDLKLFRKVVERLGVLYAPSALMLIVESITRAPPEAWMEMAQILAENEPAIADLMMNDDESVRKLASIVIEMCDSGMEVGQGRQ